jgi:hypothetical protein
MLGGVRDDLNDPLLDGQVTAEAGHLKGPL